MRFGLFRAFGDRALIRRLHGEIVAAARRPALFRDYGVADTFEGRFEMMALHAGLVLRRLTTLPQPGPALAADLTDALFRHFDAALRETGVGDTTVPKKMMGLTEAFFGRNIAYDSALKGQSEPLEAALLRNALAGQGDAAQLAHYVRRCEAELAKLDTGRIRAGMALFPDVRNQT